MGRVLWLVMLAIALAGASVWAQDGCGCSEMEEGIGDDADGDPEEGPPAKKSGRKGATLVYEDNTKAYRIHLPEEWTVIRRKTKAVLELEVQPAGSHSRALITVFAWENIGDARSVPQLNLQNYKQFFKASDAKVVAKPVPQMVFRHAREGEDWIAVMAFRKVRGNGFEIRLECPETIFDRMRDPFLKGARAFEADVAPFPRIPKAYKIKKEGILTYAQHPGVKSARDTQTIIRSVEKRFKKYHGPLPKSDDERPVVYVLRQKEDARPVHQAAADANSEPYLDVAHVRLFTTPADRTDPRQLGHLTEMAHRMYFRLAYPQEPAWVRVGEGGWARSEAITGKKLPFMQADLANWCRSTIIGRLDHLESLAGQGDGSAYYEQSFIYGCFFHGGPAKYRNAYKKFLKAWRETGNAKQSAERHLYSLGIENIQQAATRWLQRGIKPVRRKSK